jgi:hypothetical protein
MQARGHRLQRRHRPPPLRGRQPRQKVSAGNQLTDHLRSEEENREAVPAASPNPTKQDSHLAVGLGRRRKGGRWLRPVE